MTGPFPLARGSRAAWESLGPGVVSALQAEFGAPVARAVSQPDGFSPAVAAVVDFENGAKVFVKAVHRQANPDSPDMYRAEARTAGQLPPSVPAPQLLWSYDDGDWVALAYEHIDGCTPALPWQLAELERVLEALGALAESNTPSTVDVGRIAEKLNPSFSCWRTFSELGADAVVNLRSIEPWAARNLERLAALESQWPGAAAGNSLVHADVRADNLLLNAERVVFVDWAHAGVGAPWVDLVFFLPSVAMQGGPSPAALFESQPIGRAAPAPAVTAVLCALTGFFLCGSLRPPPPGIPALRPFQRGQGLAAAAWLRQRTGWD